jgi:CheY-like chemotaxis protein
MGRSVKTGKRLTRKWARHSSRGSPDAVEKRLDVDGKKGLSRTMSSEGKDESRRPEPGWQAPYVSRPPLLVFHVNDSTDDQVIFQSACAKAGIPFHWHVAETAERGISYLDSLVAMSRKEPVRWPDLVILDVVMPGGSGLKVLEHMRKTAQLRLIPVVIFTGHPSPEVRDAAFKLGANAFHEKPEDFAGMVEFVQQLYGYWTLSKRPKI